MGGVLSGANELVYGATGLDVTGGHAAKEGLASQQQAAADSNYTQLQMYNQTRADQAPWREAGANALGQITNNLGYYNQSFTNSDFQKDPGYQFRLDEGNKAIERSAASKGGLNSGATMKALTRYSSGVASDEYNQAYSRFMGTRQSQFNNMATLAGIGQNATNQTSAANQSYANAYGANATGAANAQAAYGQQQQGMTMGMIGMGAGLYAGSKGWI